MNDNKIKLKINEKSLKIVIGVAICSLAIILALNHGYISEFLFWVCSLIFGSIFTYIFAFIIFLYGLSFFINKKITFHNIRFLLIGLIMISIGVLIATTNSISYKNGDYLTFNNFVETLIDSMNLNEFPKVNVSKTGGFIGYLLVAILNSAMTDLGSKIFSSILIAIGTVFSLIRPLLQLIKSIKTDKKEIAFKQTDYNENKEELSLIDNISSSTNELFRDGNIDEPSLINEDKNLSTNVDTSKKTTNDDLSNNKNSYQFKINSDYKERNEFINKSTSKKIYENSGLEKVKFKLGESNDDNYETKSINDNNYVENNNINNDILGKSNYIQDSFGVNNTNFESETKSNELLNKIQEPKLTESVSNSINNEANIKVEFNDNDINNENPIINKKSNDTKQTIKYKPFKTVPSDYLEDRNSVEEEERNKLCAENRMSLINNILSDLKIKATIVGYTIGPSVTRYDLKTEASASINGIAKYMDDISVRLGGMDARFVPIVQGKTTSGIEIANEDRSLVNFKDVYMHLPLPKQGSLFIPFGKNISGSYINADLVDFPHMLVCGTTGSGKSIFMHSVILSLIMRNSPEDLRLVMVDPKRVEFSKYKEMPHLLCPIITEPTEASATLQKLVDEMEDRYTKFELTGVSNIKQFNQYATETHTEKLPYIIVIIDEFADLIESVKSVEKPVQRLGQKARAAGIHMIIATQRPSTDVITGSIKANLGTRVALLTSSTTDSMVILGEGGAEKLLGNGDMLVSCNLISKQEKPRVQGCFVDNMEIKRVVDYLKANYPLNYNDKFVGLLEKTRLEQNDLGVIHEVPQDEMYETVKQFIMESKAYCSISMIQREFNFGFNRSNKIFAQLKQEGIIDNTKNGNSNKGSKVLVHTSDYKEPTEGDENPGSYSQSSFEAK